MDAIIAKMALELRQNGTCMAYLDDTQRRSVALFVRDVWRDWLKKHLRQPSAVELVVASYATSLALIDAEIGNSFRYRGAPGHMRGALREISAGAAHYSRQLTDVADNVIAYLVAASDSPVAKPESVATDRRILAVAARDFHRHFEFSERSLAREIGLSRPVIHERLVARADGR